MKRSLSAIVQLDKIFVYIVPIKVYHHIPCLRQIQATQPYSHPLHSVRFDLLDKS